MSMDNTLSPIGLPTRYPDYPHGVTPRDLYREDDDFGCGDEETRPVDPLEDDRDYHRDR